MTTLAETTVPPAISGLELRNLLEKIQNVRVLCIGDIMLDTYLFGSVTRISPEAPIPILQVKEEKRVLGGVGNVARNLASLKVSSYVLAVVGKDVVAGEVLALLQKECAPYVHHTLLTEEKRHTTQKTRHIAGQQQLLRTDDESAEPLPTAIEDTLIEAALIEMRHRDVVLLSDYGKGVLSERVCQAVITAAKQAGLTVIVDPKGKDYTKYRGATYITPNRQELELASGQTTQDDAAVVAAAHSLMRQYSIQGIIATRSEKGMSLIDKNNFVAHIPTEALEVFDVSGAGDTVAALIAAGLASKAELVSVATLANVAAGIVVSKQGTAVATIGEMRQALRRRDVSFRQQTKILEWQALQEQVEFWKQQGLTVGFTNGCFDILHLGHVSYLSYARQHCDRLVLGLNSDASVRALKGETRPINTEQARAGVLAALEMIDAVVIFGEETPEKLIQTIIPDVLIKGADYTEDAIAGAAFVKQHGGRVVLAPLVPGLSTTGLLKKAQG